MLATMTLPSIAHHAPAENPTHLKLDLCHLQDEIEASPSARLRTRSSSRDSILRKRLHNAGSGSNLSLNREGSSYSLTTRPFSRSRSGNDLRTMVTSRNALNNAKNNAEQHQQQNGGNTVSGRPPLPRAGSMANLPSSRINTSRVERANSKHSLMANPRSSSGGQTSTRTTPSNTPTMQRKIFNNHVVPSKASSNPDVRFKGSANSNSPVNNIHQSPASTPDVRRRIIEFVEQGQGQGHDSEGSRPSSGQQSSAHSIHRHGNTGNVVTNPNEGKIFREVRMICNSAQQQISESNISRKEKVIHIVADADDKENKTIAKQQNNNKTVEQSLDPENPTFLSNPATTQNTTAQNDTKSQSDSIPTETKPSSKLFINRDNISPPPTPKVGVREDGEGLSMDVFMKCVDWLDGVHKANEHRTLDVVTLPPIKWDE